MMPPHPCMNPHFTRSAPFLCACHRYRLLLPDAHRSFVFPAKSAVTATLMALPVHRARAHDTPLPLLNPLFLSTELHVQVQNDGPTSFHPLEGTEARLAGRVDSRRGWVVAYNTHAPAPA